MGGAGLSRSAGGTGLLALLAGPFWSFVWHHFCASRANFLPTTGLTPRSLSIEFTRVRTTGETRDIIISISSRAR